MCKIILSRFQSYINSDASELAVGEILYQKDGICGYFSKKLNDAQSRYNTMEKEMFAIWKCINHWKGLIGGSKIIVKTDNKNLLGNHSNLDKRTARWMAELTEFNLSYEFVEGKTNIIADELSRSIDEINQKFNESKKIRN
ncbi:putative transposable element [Pseudoloma neurophilia]|uniref:Putative transposable element n=1 Tax=Pseudoloma neurophilia TaxID=146866 RepID=A0A0R0LYJ9_9MICR|nr:putative transposable element [Pseudoloma neurophilia]